MSSGAHLEPKRTPNSRWREIVGSRGVQMIGLALVVGSLAWLWLGEAGGLTELRERHWTAAAAVLIPLQALVSLTPFPGEVVALASGACLGFWWGAAAIWFAWMVTAFVQYALVYRTAKDLDFSAALDRLPGWIRSFPVEHPVFLIVGRWLPYGAHVVNSAAGAFRVPLWRFAWCAAIGIGAGALVMSALANGFAWF